MVGGQYRTVIIHMLMLSYAVAGTKINPIMDLSPVDFCRRNHVAPDSKTSCMKKVGK
jgi:hypothetical protein